MGNLLAFSVVAMLIGFVMATVAMFDLHFSQGWDAGQTAQRLANSAVHMGIANITRNPGFAGDLVITGQDGWGRLSFNAGNALGLPPSTNNWEGRNPNGFGRGVPQGMVHLVGVGECRGLRRQVEALIDLPVYPLAIACSGPVTLDEVSVASIKDDMLDRDLAEILASPLGPGNLASNSRRSAAAITLQRNTKVTGFVQSCGGIAVNGANIEGEVRQNWPDLAELPDMQASYLDPRKPDPADDPVFHTQLKGRNPATLNGHYSDVTISNPTRVDATLEIDGPLVLNDGMLYVDGDLVVQGGIIGQGAVGVKGRVSIRGRSRLRSTSRVAVVADGDIVLSGDDKTSQVFEGILYGRGTIRAEGVTVLGACIQNAPAGSPANEIGVVLHNANLIWATAPAGPSFDPPIDILIASAAPREGGGADLSPTKLSPTSRENDGIVGHTSVRHSPVSRKAAGPGDFTDSSNTWGPDDIMLMRTRFDASGNPRFAIVHWGQTTDDPPQPLRNPDGTPLISGVFYASVDALLNAPDQGTDGGRDAVWWILDNDPNHPGSGEYNFPKRTRYGAMGSGGYQEYGDMAASEETIRANLSRTVDQLLAMRQDLLRRSPTRRNHFTMDPSRFLSRTKAVRIHYWREM